jgi:arabinose-5-phosphate isomerase
MLICGRRAGGALAMSTGSRNAGEGIMLDLEQQARVTARSTVAVPRTAAEAQSQSSAYLASAKRTLLKERQGLDTMLVALEDGLGTSFVAAVEVLRRATGRVILSGVGKSGHIARKIAATLASTGTPAMFVHPTEASHGDLGTITPDDVIIVLSNSGETVELKDLIAYSRRFKVPLIAITANNNSTVAKTADVALSIPRAPEACPIGLAPTTSTTMQLALGDALAITLLEDKGFTASDFQRFHPGGRLGAALAHVRDFMHTGDELPLAPAAMEMSRALIIMTEKSFGCLGVTDEAGALMGIITDGDLRRKMGDGLLSQSAGEVMTPAPKVVAPDALAQSALEIINSAKITSLFVVEDGLPVGIVHVHDLLRVGVR